MSFFKDLFGGKDAGKEHPKLSRDAQIDEEIATIFRMLADTMGTERLVIQAGKMNAMALMRSEDRRERVLALMRILEEDPLLSPPPAETELPEILSRMTEQVAGILARRDLEDRIERKVNEKLEKDHEEYVDDIRRQVISEESPGAESPHDKKKREALEALEKVHLTQSVMELLRPKTFDEIVGQERAVRSLMAKLSSPYPQHLLLYGPPGNGKTMIAKAVANSLAARAAALNPGTNTRGYFLNIKGPELLDKFVGETERQIRDIFVAAREKAQAGHPVVVFFDEMESLFRTRGTGRSSDIETTIVPQLLAEIDGVESLQNVIVIGATNREDLIDAAVMRPGRLDLKIRINRPDASDATEIFGLYLTDDLPLDPHEVAKHGSADATLAAMISAAVAQLYARTSANAYVAATLDQGINTADNPRLHEETLYRGDFVSGAVIRNIVDRAKKYAIKEHLSYTSSPPTGIAHEPQPEGITTRHLLEAVRAEFEDQVELPPLPDVEDALTVRGIRGRILSITPPHTATTP